MLRLPVSGLDVELRSLRGLEEMFLMEAESSASSTAVALLERLMAIPPATLPITDLETLLLELRRRTLGDHIHTVVRCPQPGCSALVDVEFQVSALLGHHRPRLSAARPDPDRPGWYQLRDTAGVYFRLPTGADQLAVIQAPEPVLELVRRTMEPASLPAATRRKVERAMERLAPALSSTFQGHCPECGAEVGMEFDVATFVMAELRQQAAYLFEDIHRLALAYRWSEEAILALPSRRRARYAEAAAHWLSGGGAQ